MTSEVRVRPLPDLSDLPSIDALTVQARGERIHGRRMPLLRTQVALVARMMDKDNPRWFTHVNPRTLDMLSTTRCALGQSYGPDHGWFDGGRGRLERAFDEYDLWHEAVDGTHETSVAGYWRAEIELRMERYDNAADQ